MVPTLFVHVTLTHMRRTRLLGLSSNLQHTNMEVEMHEALENTQPFSWAACPTIALFQPKMSKTYF